MYHNHTLKLYLDKLPPTSTTIRTHILRAYFQAYLWYHSPFQQSIEMNPEEYGYHVEDEILVPTIETVKKLPENFPKPCNCGKCARKNVCPCRVKTYSVVNFVNVEVESIAKTFKTILFIICFQLCFLVT